MREHEHPREYGLTIIEAIVSISIVSIISGLLLVGASPVRRAAPVRNGALALAGFLRETATLAVNGVKEPSCGTTAECSQYAVHYVGGSGAYTRAAAGGGATAERRLPLGVRFARSGSVTFRLVPPLLSVETESGLLSPGTKHQIPVEHVSGGQRWQVCVDGGGGVSVAADLCEP